MIPYFYNIASFEKQARIEFKEHCYTYNLYLRTTAPNNVERSEEHRVNLKLLCKYE